MKTTPVSRFVISTTLCFLITMGSCSVPNQDKTSPYTASLIEHTIDSENHPITVWEKSPLQPKGSILFVHGRTWSALPDFDLQVEGEELSLMDGMVHKGYASYAVDLRGYGKTPRDSSEWNTPMKAATDIINVLNWIQSKQGKSVHLFGWSMGSTLSLLATQLSDENIASLTLFGFWKDLDDLIPEDTVGVQLQKIVNTPEAAASDFITEGSISNNAVQTYVKVALEADPIKVDWKELSQYNRLEPGLIEVPTLVMQGEFDPIAPTNIQTKLFTRLRTADKSWSVIAGGDHAAHLEKPRERFIDVLISFIDRYN